MTSSNPAALFCLFVLAISAIYAVASPVQAMAADREFRSVPERTLSAVDTFRLTHVKGRAAQLAEAQKGLRARHLVILFHGLRGRGAVMEAVAESWQATLPDIAYVAPDAPFPHGSGGRQWFAVDDQVMRPERIEAARRAFDDMVSDIIKREGFEGALDRVAFVGVSQGAIMALDAVASGRWKVGALVSFAGLLPLPPTSTLPATKILLMHGEADRTIPSAATVAAANQLKSAGFDVTSEIFPGVGHTISPAESREAAAFLRKRFE